jgi:hypothetical protein
MAVKSCRRRRDGGVVKRVRARVGDPPPRRGVPATSGRAAVGSTESPQYLGIPPSVSSAMELPSTERPVFASPMIGGAPTIQSASPNGPPPYAHIHATVVALGNSPNRARDAQTKDTHPHLPEPSRAISSRRARHRPGLRRGRLPKALRCGRFSDQLWPATRASGRLMSRSRGIASRLPVGIIALARSKTLRDRPAVLGCLGES